MASRKIALALSARSLMYVCSRGHVALSPNAVFAHRFCHARREKVEKSRKALRRLASQQFTLEPCARVIPMPIGFGQVSRAPASAPPVGAARHRRVARAHGLHADRLSPWRTERAQSRSSASPNGLEKCEECPRPAPWARFGIISPRMALVRW